MAAKSLEVRVLAQATELMGGERALAAQLQITEKELEAFLAGTLSPTRAVFLAAVDALLEFGNWSSLDGEIPAASCFTPTPGAVHEQGEPKR